MLNEDVNKTSYEVFEVTDEIKEKLEDVDSC